MPLHRPIADRVLLNESLRHDPLQPDGGAVGDLRARRHRQPIGRVHGDTEIGEQLPDGGSGRGNAVVSPVMQDTDLLGNSQLDVRRRQRQPLVARHRGEVVCAEPSSASASATVGAVVHTSRSTPSIVKCSRRPRFRTISVPLRIFVLTAGAMTSCWATTSLRLLRTPSTVCALVFTQLC